MPKKSWIAKQKRTPKFKTRKYNRCNISGRRRSTRRKFGLARTQLRELISFGEVPGVTKASW